MKKTILEIVENSKGTHPIVLAAREDNRYWRDFLNVNNDYMEKLSEHEYRNFLAKSQLDCEITMDQYLSFSSETTVIDYILRNYEKIKYEPKYNGRKNPECAFEYDGRTVNIEVKCPNLSTKVHQERNTDIRLFASERLPQKDDILRIKDILEARIEGEQNIQIVDRLDNKLKDYLLSAHRKFPASGASYFNILVIALDIISDMDEWYSYLFGNGGAFTNNTYISEEYSNVDAVMLTNVQHGHMPHKVNLGINCWKLENYISLLLLNPIKEKTYGLGEYYAKSALNMFGGITWVFLKFLDKLDQINLHADKCYASNLSNEQRKRLAFLSIMDYKITESQIISQWIKSFPKF